MVMCTDRLWRKALESLRSRTGMHWWPVCRSCICIRIFVFVFVFVQGLARLRSMAGMHWAVCRLCNFSRRPLPQPGINLSRVWYNLESTSPEAQLGQTYGATCNIQVQVAPVCLRSYRLCVRSLCLCSYATRDVLKN